MKYKVKTEVETEIEIELPYFFKLTNNVINDSYFAITIFTKDDFDARQF